MRWTSSLIGILAFVTLACAGAQAPAAPAQPAKPAASAPEPAKPAAQAEKPAAATKALELRAGSSQPKGDPMTNAIERFAELVDQKSNGAIKIRVFPQSLGVEQQLTQAVMNGSVDMGIISNGNAGRFTSAFYVFDLPFVFKDNDSMLKALRTPLGQERLAQFEKDLGLKVLFPVHFGVGRDIQTSKRQIKTPADIRGLKIRVLSTPVDLSIFKAWGANPTPVDWAQTYTAIQQGVVEGMQVPYTALKAQKWYEILHDNLRIDYLFLFEPFHMNAKLWQSLTPEQQKVLTDAAKEAEEFHYQDVKKLITEDRKFLETEGKMRFYDPSPQEREQWLAIRDQVWNQIAEEQKGKIDMHLARKFHEEFGR
jgi:tripartite ATP-independent transporter DctP family solute receptor